MFKTEKQWGLCPYKPEQRLVHSNWRDGFLILEEIMQFSISVSAIQSQVILLNGTVQHHKVTENVTFKIIKMFNQGTILRAYMQLFNLLLVCVSWTIIGVSHETASSSAECSRDKPPFSFVRGQDSTMWDTVWVSPQGHRSVSVSRRFLLLTPQCPCSVRKRFSRDHCCRGRSKPGCRIVGSHTRWELTQQ